MAIIGIVWFSLSFFCIAVMKQSAYEYASKNEIDGLAAGWGYLATLYALAIVVKIKNTSIPNGQNEIQNISINNGNGTG